MTGIEGKVVAITGASSGIGEATALRLAAGGAKVVLGARGAGRLEALATRIADAGGEVSTLATDVTRRADLAALVAHAVERFGRLDVLVASAGVGRTGPLDELPVDEWDEMVDVNLRGVLHGIAAALPVFKAQGSGQFVTVASTSGLKVVPTQAVYAATKTAVRVLSDGLRQELAEHGLRVSLVTPGFTNTPFAEGAKDPAVRAEYVRRRDAIAMPADAVAAAIAYVVEQPEGVDVGEVVVRPTVQA